jgi:DNA processing protein
MSPSERADLIDWLRFHIAFLYQPHVGQDLLDRLGDPGRALRLPADALEAIPGLAPQHRAALADPRIAVQAGSEIGRVERGEFAVLRRGLPGWPESLDGLPAMPFLLFVRGTVLPADSNAVGVVGSRRPSPYGLRQAARFAAGLAAAGITVVSGLARGIDAAAHRGALEAGGRTIAVLGSGLGRIYPGEHRDLARRVAGAGAVLTEFPWDSAPRQFHFPHRNRILSALSRAVLVVEAGERSGSLITADWAAEQDREVFAVPGRVDAEEARGCLRLIQDGARLVADPEEIAEVLGVRPPKRPAGEEGPPVRGSRRVRELPAHLAPLFDEEDAWHPDAVIGRLGRPPGEVLAELARLEALGVLSRLPSGAYVEAR